MIEQLNQLFAPVVTDSHLTRLEYDWGKRSLDLQLKSSTLSIAVSAADVECMVIDDFLEQNVVDELICYGRQSSETDVLNILAYLLFRKSGTSDLQSEAQIEATRSAAEAISLGNKMILQIVPISGAAVVVLAKSVMWSCATSAE